MARTDTDELIHRALRGERVPLARAISLVENEAPQAVPILDAVFARSGECTLPFHCTLIPNLSQTGLG